MISFSEGVMPSFGGAVGLRRCHCQAARAGSSMPAPKHSASLYSCLLQLVIHCQQHGLRMRTSWSMGICDTDRGVTVAAWFARRAADMPTARWLERVPVLLLDTNASTVNVPDWPTDEQPPPLPRQIAGLPCCPHSRACCSCAKSWAWSAFATAVGAALTLAPPLALASRATANQW